jgi:hypothetical protein
MIRKKFAKGKDEEGTTVLGGDEREVNDRNLGGRDEVVESGSVGGKEDGEDEGLPSIEDLKVSNETNVESKEDSKSTDPEEGEVIEEEDSSTVAETDSKPKEHPLQHTWTLSFDSRRTLWQATEEANQSKEEGGSRTVNVYANAVQTIGEFNTVEMFCRYAILSRIRDSII